MPKHVPTLPASEATTLPLSQVIEANGFVFLAGQVGNAPGGEGAVPGGIEAETRQMLDNVGRLLRAVGLDYHDVDAPRLHLAAERVADRLDPELRGVVGRHEG